MKAPAVTRIIERTTVYVALITVFTIAVIPFVWMITTSIKPGEGIFTCPPRWFPEHPTLMWYKQLFRDVDLMLHFKNSLIVSVTTTALNLFFCSLAGFAFAKLRFAGRNRIFTLLMATLMIPGQITMIPVFLFLKKLGLLNTYWGLILPSSVGIFGIFLIRQF